MSTTIINNKKDAIEKKVHGASTTTMSISSCIVSYNIHKSEPKYRCLFFLPTSRKNEINLNRSTVTRMFPKKSLLLPTYNKKKTTSAHYIVNKKG